MPDLGWKMAGGDAELEVYRLAVVGDVCGGDGAAVVRIDADGLGYQVNKTGWPTGEASRHWIDRRQAWGRWSAVSTRLRPDGRRSCSWYRRVEMTRQLRRGKQRRGALRRGARHVDPLGGRGA